MEQILTDEDLLAAALAGRQEAWAELVERYNALGIRWLRRHVDDPHLARDILQNLWVSLVSAVRREPPDRFAALFWTLLRRRLIDELRRKGRTKEAAILDAPREQEDPGGASLADRQSDAAPSPEAAVLQSEEASLVQRALAELPDHYRLVILCRQFEGRSNKETAARLVAEGLVTDDGNVEKRVENYYYRGLKELRKQLLALGYAGGGAG